MKIIFAIFFTIFLVSYIFRLLSPYILRRYLKKIQKRFDKKFGENSEQWQNPQKQKDGQVRVNYTKKPSKKIDSNVGDYVDFEDVK